MCNKMTLIETIVNVSMVEEDQNCPWQGHLVFQFNPDESQRL